MSYATHICPCGGHKEADTMLCAECVEAFKDRRELVEYQDANQSYAYRRNAAIILVTLARGRKRKVAA